MVVAGPSIDGSRVTARLALADGRTEELTWVLERPPGPGAADALAAATLLPAMSLGEELRLEGPVSPRLLCGMETVQSIFACWGEHAEIETAAPAPFRRVPVTATPRPEPAPPRADGVACFFTAGADSFYSVLKHRDELTALVYVHGFDVPLDDSALRERVGEGVREAAALIGLPLVEVEADLRAFSEPWLDWLDYHGAALASVALMLADDFGRVYVPATHTYALLNPLGSHPLVDPLWSTERVELVHDGCEATRREKLVAIAECEAARRRLRVCWENLDGEYNCGRCEKCVRTLVELRLLGLAERFESFPELDLAEVGRVPIHFGGWAWRDALQGAERSGHDPALTEALRTALRRYRLGPRDPGNGTTSASDARPEWLETMTSAAATAAERDRLTARLGELERTLADMRGSRAWRAAVRVRRTRDGLRRHIPGRRR